MAVSGLVWSDGARFRLVPEAPPPNLLALVIAPLGCLLTVLMEATPSAVFLPLDADAFRIHGAIFVERHEQAVSNPSRAIRCHEARIAEPERPTCTEFRQD